jgi:hypothetical protein
MRPSAPSSARRAAQFDATKLSWLGTPAIETNVCIAYNTAPVKTVQDLLEKQLVVGDTGPGTGTRYYPKALNADVFLAMERGEVQGICESLDSIEVAPLVVIAKGDLLLLHLLVPEDIWPHIWPPTALVPKARAELVPKDVRDGSSSLSDSVCIKLPTN